MTPFHPDLENDAGHTIDQNDLIAFHLHELSSPQERAVHRVLHTNPALQSESIAIASTLRAFPKHEAPLPLDAAALDRHWQALRPSLTAYIPPTPTPFALFKLPAMRWALPTAAAAILATAALILTLHRAPQPTPTTVATSTPPTATTTPNPMPPLSAISPSNSVPTITSIPSVSLSIASSPTSPPPQTNPFVPTNSSQAQPTSSQPTTAPSPTSASPANTSIAANHQSNSIAEPAPNEPTTARPVPRPHHEHTTDITLAVIGNLTLSNASTSGTATYTQSTTPAIGVLASFHQQFRPWLGYRIIATHSEPTFLYGYQVPTPYANAPVTTTAGNTVYEHVYEVAGTYVVKGPRYRRISTSAEAGIGLLAFLPPGTNIGNPPLLNAYRPEAVVGISGELALTQHLALHAGYRALLYKAPTSYYGTSYGVAVPSDPGNLTLSNEPVIGLTYRFHPSREE